MNDSYVFITDNLSSYVINNYTDVITDKQPFVIFDRTGLNYTELGIFISGIILSCGGFLALILGNIRKSNCKSVDCCFFKCKRENLEIEDV